MSLRVKKVTLPQDALDTRFMTTNSKNLIRYGWQRNIVKFAELLLSFRWFGTRDYTMVLIILSFIIVVSEDEKGKKLLQKASKSSLEKICEHIGAGEGKSLKTYLETNLQAAWYKDIFYYVLGHCDDVGEKQKGDVWEKFLNQVGKMIFWVKNGDYVRNQLCGVVKAAFDSDSADTMIDSLEKSLGGGNGSSTTEEQKKREAAEEERKRREAAEEERKRREAAEEERKRREAAEEEQKKREAAEEERKRREAAEEEQKKREAAEEEQKKREAAEEERKRREAAEEEQKKREAAEEERKRREAEQEREEQGPRVFFGLPNGDSYCYLNTALQSLYDMEKFRDRVLKSNPTDEDKFKELRAVKFFFEYLKSGEEVADFDDRRQKEAENLGYTIGVPDSSGTMMCSIEQKCLDQLQKLESGSSDVSEPDELGDDKQNEYITKYIANNYFGTSTLDFSECYSLALRIFGLYEDVSIRERILEIKESDFFLEDSFYDFLKPIWNAFLFIKDRKGSELIELLNKHNNKGAISFKALKEKLLDDLSKFKGAKCSRSLYADSAVVISWNNGDVGSTVKETIKNYFKRNVQQGKTYCFALNDNRFSVILGDRGNAEARTNFSVEETIDFDDLVKNKKLKLFSDNEELKEGPYKFDLISATIGTGGHFYVYKKVIHGWKEFNDGMVVDVNWDNIKNNIAERCETLVYKLGH